MQKNKIACIGLGGIGISSLARMLCNMGYEIWGCDDFVDIRKLQEKLPEVILVESNTPLPNIDTVIYSDAVPFSHQWRQEAVKRGIETFSYFEYVGKLTQTETTWAIAGTNGKSSTTALTGLLAEAAGLDPRVIVGTYVNAWGSNGRFGKGLFIIEADEYMRHLLHIHPTTALVTNVEADHLECYGSLNEIIDTFRSFLLHSKVQKIIINGDDKVSRESLWDIFCSKIRGGFGGRDSILPHADFWLQDNGTYWSGDAWEIKWLWHTQNRTQKISTRLPSPGHHMVMNAMAAAAVGLSNEIPPYVIEKTLPEFKGTWRRFEIIAQIGEHVFVSDYGHHPTAIVSTLKGAREAYPCHKIYLIYEPHQRRRSLDFKNEFKKAFSLADYTRILPIYEPAGREENISIQSDELCDKKDLHVIPTTHEKVLDEIKNHLGTTPMLFIAMGAGPIDAWWRKNVATMVQNI